MSLVVHRSTRIFTALLLALPLFAAAQAPRSKSAPLILDVTVTDKSGAPVPSLRSSDFTVLADKLPQTILDVHPVDTSKEPLSVILVLDAVNTSYQEVAFERTQLQKFLSASDGKLAHPTTLAILTDKGVQMSPSFTLDGNAIRATLDHYDVSLRTITRSSGFYGAQDRLDISLNGLSQLAMQESSLPGRKLVLFLSPGWPILSGVNIDLSSKQQESIYQQIVRMSTLLRTARIALYAINPYGASEGLERVFYYQNFLGGVRKPSEAALGNLSLQVLAIQSGGQALNSTGIAQLLDQCLAANRTYYRIAIPAPPVDRPDDYKAIQVKLANPALNARTSAGIYLQP